MIDIAIEEKNPDGVARRLKKLKTLRQKPRWESYLKKIREKNRLKRKLLEILDMLEKRR